MNIIFLIHRHLAIKSIFDERINDQFEITKKSKGWKFKKLLNILNDEAESYEVAISQEFFSVQFDEDGITLISDFFSDEEYEEYEDGDNSRKLDPIGRVLVWLDKFGNYEKTEKIYD